MLIVIAVIIVYPSIITLTMKDGHFQLKPIVYPLFLLSMGRIFYVSEIGNRNRYI